MCERVRAERMTYRIVIRLHDQRAAYVRYDPLRVERRTSGVVRRRRKHVSSRTRIAPIRMPDTNRSATVLQKRCMCWHLHAFKCALCVGGCRRTELISPARHRNRPYNFGRTRRRAICVVAMSLSSRTSIIIASTSRHHRSRRRRRRRTIALTRRPRTSIT